MKIFSELPEKGLWLIGAAGLVVGLSLDCAGAPWFLSSPTYVVSVSAWTVWLVRRFR